MRYKRIRCKSGIYGSQYRLQDGYGTFEEFSSYDVAYGLAKRLGYKNATTAWKANPMIQSSICPSDFRKVPRKEWER